MAEKFCLKWNDFERNISSAFRDIRDEKEFFDITLACDDDQLQAHKVILSACSPFFKQVLKRNPHQHPLLYLKGVSYKDMQAVLNFMYHGEVNVAQDELNSFLQVAEDLRVKGLTQNTNSSAARNNKAEPRTSVPSLRRASSETSAPTAAQPPSKRFRPDPVKVTPASEESEDDIQEVLPVKAEPLAVVGPPPDTGTMTMYSEDPGELVLEDESNFEEGYTEEDYDQTEYTEQNYLVPGADGSSGSRALCTICNKYVHKSSLKRHLRTVHTENSAVQCPDCYKTFKNVESLDTHQRTVHRPVDRSLAGYFVTTSISPK